MSVFLVDVSMNKCKIAKRLKNATLMGNDSAIWLLIDGCTAEPEAANIGVTWIQSFRNGVGLGAGGTTTTDQYIHEMSFVVSVHVHSHTALSLPWPSRRCTNHTYNFLPM